MLYRVANRATFRMILRGVFSLLLIQAINLSCRTPRFSGIVLSTFFSTRKATSFNAHQLLESGIDVKIGYIETHGRVETEALVEGLPVIPRRKIFYKGKEIEEMDLQSILSIHPEVVIVDELAHTNVEGSKNEKRWQDVMDILDAGISVITAVNIQHIEGLNEMVQDVVGIEVKERIPDIVLEQADEVVNIDLTADELLARLKAGKIYKPDKIQTALNNFFKAEHILQLRELALKSGPNFP